MVYIGVVCGYKRRDFNYQPPFVFTGKLESVMIELRAETAARMISGARQLQLASRSVTG